MKKEIRVMPSPSYPGWPKYPNGSKEEALALAQCFKDAAVELGVSVPELENRLASFRRVRYLKRH